MNNLLTRVRRAFGRSAEGTVAYRITLERDPDADRATYVKRVESITKGLETSIRDAASGTFEAVAVSRTADPYSRTMAAIEQEEDRLTVLNRKVAELPTMSNSDIIAEREKTARRLDELQHDERPRTANTFVYTVFHEPQLSQTSEAIASEFDRLSTLDSVEAVELQSDTPETDPRNSIDFQTQEDGDR